MSQDIAVVGIDLSKLSFQIHAVDRKGKAVIRKKLYRSDVLDFIKSIPCCTVAMEACSSSNHWGREFQKLGHTVKLIPPQYVKPFVKTNKHDAADAEAIVEAASRPAMRFVEVKSIEQQEILALHRTRERLMKSKTALLNALRGLLSEYGIISPKGVSWLNRSLATTRERCEKLLSPIMLSVFERTLAEYRAIETEIEFYDKQLQEVAKANPATQRLMKIPGVGVIAATAALAIVNSSEQFKNGRHFAAYLGLVPRQHATGGKQKLLGISKRGNSYLRRILVSGAQSVMRWSKKKQDYLSKWAVGLMERKSWNVAAVAIANKNARIIWHLICHDDQIYVMQPNSNLMQ